MGRSLEDIDLFFRESPSVWATVRFSKKSVEEIRSNTEGMKQEVEHSEYSN